ncbi:MAG TPA: fumarylacetoacetate hydrolase family protein [Lacipirellulaceae bacterium]|nr:fumarylacetoacetate hydrolase family protein [Lacipirellulaceae bacterium]
MSDRPGGLRILLPDRSWDDVFSSIITKRELSDMFSSAKGAGSADPLSDRELLPPIGSQEVWAAGVTYLRSRTARMEESATAGGSDFYDRVYNAHRPELFFKATPHRVVGHGQTMRLRNDSRWNVPEPELTLAFSNRGKLLGYCIGNDLSSRDIEGENPLYLPQAKVFDTCAALGPGLLLTDAYPSGDTSIRMSIRRENAEAFGGETRIANMKQPFENLREHLFRNNSFPLGCYLMTGTGIVPDDDFTLQPGDEISITIDDVGTLMNFIA